MKKIKTFILVFAILWAFFYTIYANIKANEVYELETQNQKLIEEAIELQEKAIQEAMNAKEAEAAALRAKNALELCRSGQ